MSKTSDFITKSEAELKDMIIQLKREVLNLSFQRDQSSLYYNGACYAQTLPSP